MHPSSVETLRIVSEGSFATKDGQIEFAQEQAAAVSGTRLFTPQELARLEAPPPGKAGTLAVVDATTQVAAAALAPHVTVLNFASARRVGGGFRGGARAQEEDLCRCSGLYPCLQTQPDYYRANRSQHSFLYTDHIIWSPAVPFFRLRGNDLPDRLFLAGVVTAPAPNRRPMVAQEPESLAEVPATLERRWRNVLAVAVAMKQERLVLGAWGCGVFGNAPTEVAEAFLRAWSSWCAAFTEVTFAIPSANARSRENLEGFRAVLGR
jgi:uncharacterized protein (TIGR02452 family)